MVFLKTFPLPTEGVKHQQDETEAVLDGKGLGTGTLYIAESRLLWFDGSGMGFSLEYPSISLHAVSRDPTAYPQEHLYVLVNAKLGEDEPKEAAMDNDPDEEEDSDEEDTEPITEIRFVPTDKSALEPMFTAMCECQALHPDPEDEDSDDDDDFEGEEYDVEAHERGQGDIPTFYTYEEGLSHLTSEGHATLERLEGMLAQSTSQQFHMAGVRTEATAGEFEDGMEVDTVPSVAGQFEDADVDH
ncbi:methylosome subunit pICln [Latimeria chalumnae]|uniref:Methylosome subunit pICln n=1 Tax=Latimeria chalumnae TaxID=7897 RepID=H3A8H3_LATCH|nr:PREDICTED: methylosome subunit pICln [Latimeria chalumnae]|eukprot:XP_006006363.1 PREDICTED: methylosome subunit pICln [Latimeria chalumnae]